MKSSIICISIISLLIGICLLNGDKIEYPTGQYWVANDYHHVYDASSGEIVDMITEDETCTIKDDMIIVRTKPKTYNFGMTLIVISAIILAVIIISYLEFL